MNLDKLDAIIVESMLENVEPHSCHKSGFHPSSDFMLRTVVLAHGKRTRMCIEEFVVSGVVSAVSRAWDVNSTCQLHIDL